MSIEVNTRISQLMYQVINLVKNKIFLKKKNFFSLKLFLVFVGFLIGNLFGIFLPCFPNQINSASSVLVVIIFIIEGINYLVYHSEKRVFFVVLVLQLLIKPVLSKIKLNQFFCISWINFFKNKQIYKNINFLKIGILLGFFIDAFKVGS